MQTARTWAVQTQAARVRTMPSQAAPGSRHGERLCRLSGRARCLGSSILYLLTWYLVGTDVAVADAVVADAVIVDANCEDEDLEDVFVSVHVPS